jgi:rSAM/selenodomain-associated transferase 1
MNDRLVARGERCAIAIMAKAPSAGRVKTRLSPLLSPQEARDLGSCFLTDITANLALAAGEAPLDPYVAFAPAGSEAAFGSIVTPGTAFVLADGSRPAPPGVSGFGACLLQAVCTLSESGYGGIVLLNSDSPTLPTSLLVRAVHQLLAARDGVVLGPSLDGGYYLIGVRHPHAELFRAIDWSTERVAAQTRQRAQGQGLEVIELDPWYDVDEPRSLQRLVDELASPAPNSAVAYGAPVTRAYLWQHAIADRLASSGIMSSRACPPGLAAAPAPVAGAAEPAG